MQGRGSQENFVDWDEILNLPEDIGIIRRSPENLDQRTVYEGIVAVELFSALEILRDSKGNVSVESETQSGDLSSEKAAQVFSNIDEYLCSHSDCIVKTRFYFDENIQAPLVDIGNLNYEITQEATFNGSLAQTKYKGVLKESIPDYRVENILAEYGVDSDLRSWEFGEDRAKLNLAENFFDNYSIPIGL